MGIRQWIYAQATQAITSEKRLRKRRLKFERKRLKTGASHRVVFYHRVNDPYSHLLLQTLPAFRERFGIDIETVVVLLNMSEALYPAPDMLEQYALTDAGRLAGFYDLDFPTPALPVDREKALLASRILISKPGEAPDLDFMHTVGRAFWSGADQSLQRLAESFPLLSEQETLARLESNQQRLEKSGHYLSGILHYGDEWYWGLDRLGHLEQRLLDLGLSGGSRKSLYNRHHGHFLAEPVSGGDLPDMNLDFFFSFRSPYSYIAIERTFELVEKFGISLTIKPVLPMVMRGMKVPSSKRMYIVTDTKREAVLAGVPFGRIFDPVGPGTERALALFQYARSQGREREYILSVARGAWSEGIDLSGNQGLRLCLERIGLDWEACRPLLADKSWQEMAEANRKEMFNLGCWGVPTFRLGDTVTWGQDRLWVLEEKLRQLASRHT